MKIHICTENPCPVRDEECRAVLENGFKTNYVGSLLIEMNEWPVKALPTSHFLNSVLRKVGRKDRYRMQTLNNGKQIAFIKLHK